MVDADLKGYFDSIPHDRLMTRLKEKIADGSVLSLIEAFLKADLMDGLAGWTPATGVPRGAVLSPLLSTIYLDPLDHLVARSGFEMVRYADDFVLPCRTPEEASRALELVRAWVSDHGLAPHATKTKVVDARADGFDFLGYHFRDTRHWPRKEGVTKLKERVRAQTKRTNGESLRAIIGSLNRTLRGWFAYFQPHRGWHLPALDGWIRGRLRGILRRRSKRRGRGRGLDHRRWPTAYFAERGLFGLAEAHVLARQSSLR